MQISRINYTNNISKINSIKNNQINHLQNINQDRFEKQNNYNGIHFLGVNKKGQVKQRAMFCHITALPGTRSYCGQFIDLETDKFIDFLSKSKQTHWIMNPLSAVGPDLSPYNASGRFSRNKYLVNLGECTKEEYGKILKPNDLPDDVTSPVFTLEMLQKQKDPRFKKAYNNFKKLPETTPIKQEYNQFCKDKGDLWLDTYSTYNALSKRHGDNWHEWPKELIMLPDKSRETGKPLLDLTLSTLKENGYSNEVNGVKEDIGLYKFEQFLFDKQFKQFNKKLADKKIRPIFDLGIGINPNGVDTWSNKDIFLFDKNFKPTKVAGCPPEDAFPNTQYWGFPLYNYDSPRFWDYQEKSLKQLLSEGDLRLDHFVGYINRAEIPTEYKKEDGTILKGEDIFKPKEKGGMGADFFDPKWIVNLQEKRNKKGENMFDLLCRVAKEQGLKPEDCYTIESLGPLSETKAYKEFDKKHGENFVTQRIPIAAGIGKSINKAQPNNSSNPKNLNQYNVTLLTGNHDYASLREYVDLLLTEKPKTYKDGDNSPKLFREFCKKELKLNNKQMEDKENVAKKTLIWHYQQPVKRVDTTISDALGIYFRPNYPGHWLGEEDVYLKKPEPHALVRPWSNVFEKGFLNKPKTNPPGLKPGYKEKADEYIKTMQDLFG